MNGGGQIKAASNKEQQETLETVSKLYHSAPTERPEDNEIIQKLIKDWLGGMHSEVAKRMLFTGYHAIQEKAVVKW